MDNRDLLITLRRAVLLFVPVLVVKRGQDDDLVQLLLSVAAWVERRYALTRNLHTD